MKDFLKLIAALTVSRLITGLLGTGLFLALVIGVALFGGGNGSDSGSQGLSKSGVTIVPEEPSQTPSDTSVLAPETSTDPEAEASRAFTKKIATEGLINMTGDDVWHIAKRTCTLLEDGETWQEVTAEANAHPTSGEQVVQLEAVYDVCPQYKDRLPS